MLLTSPPPGSPSQAVMDAESIPLKQHQFLILSGMDTPTSIPRIFLFLFLSPLSPLPSPQPSPSPSFSPSPSPSIPYPCPSSHLISSPSLPLPHSLTLYPHSLSPSPSSPISSLSLTLSPPPLRTLVVTICSLSAFIFSCFFWLLSHALQEY